MEDTVVLGYCKVKGSPVYKTRKVLYSLYYCRVLYVVVVIIFGCVRWLEKQQTIRRYSMPHCQSCMITVVHDRVSSKHCLTQFLQSLVSRLQLESDRGELTGECEELVKVCYLFNC